MSKKRDQLVKTAERLFYREGFYATGVDRVIAEAGVARMTLYKHFRSKDELVLAVLAHREQDYWQRLESAVARAVSENRSPLLGVFEAHGRWLKRKGRHGCLFLKAIGEYASHSPPIAEAAARHKRRLLGRLSELAGAEGIPASLHLEQSLCLLLEGATAYAQILPPETAAEQARRAAETLLATHAQTERPPP